MVRVVLLLVAAAGLPLFAPSLRDDRIAANDNRTAAGRLANGVLTLELEARAGVWRPDADDAPGLEAYAFAEAGKPAQIPGPLIRVPAGTEVRLTLTNRIAGQTLYVYGLHARPGAPADRMEVESGATRTLSFKLNAPGTYTYWGATKDSAIGRRFGPETQLAGAIVVDAPGAATPRDRVFVITQYMERLDPLGGPAENTIFVSAINGKSWPHTQRLDYATGDTVEWRVVNGSSFQHPMHLHGFYYRIHARGDGVRDSSYAAGTEPRVVTDRLLAASTMRISWVAERAGNWLFHCHIPGHVAPHKPLDGSKLAVKATHMSNHALEGMGGLMLGVHVTGGPAAVERTATRRLRLLARADSAGGADQPAYRFALDQPDVQAQTGIGQMPSPVLVLKRNEPVAITVVNTLGEPTAVHWHGIELESYYDGVAGFGGTPGRIAPVIEPGDSFIARFTPPRAGTFIYHTHVDELRQEPAGLGGIIVVSDGQFDRATDHPVLISTAETRRGFLINGSTEPKALEFRAGIPQRLRIVDLMLGPPRGVLVTLMQDTTVQSWRPLAKDGADLPGAVSIPQRATVQATTGETYDFEVVLHQPGEYRLDLRVPGAVARAPRHSLAIRVK